MLYIYIKEYWIVWMFIASSATVVCNALEKSQCVGREITVDCVSPSLLIHIEYEVYGYNADANICTISDSTCTGVEFMRPTSLQHCTGRTSCSYTVPNDKQLITCFQNATVVSVIYQCLEKTKTYDICSDFLITNSQTTYLMTPNYPSDTFQAMKCNCEISGTEVNVTTLEHFKAIRSPVVFTMTTDAGTQHITDNRIINKIEYINISKIEIDLFNEHQNQIFRAWLKITGKDFQVKCGSPVILQPTPTTPYVTKDGDYPSQSSYPYKVTDQSTLLSGSMSTNTVDEVSTKLSTPEMKSSGSGQVMTELSTLAQHTHIITELSTLVIPTSHTTSTPVDSSSSLSTSASVGTVHGNSTVTDNNGSGTSSEWVIIVAISASVGFLVLILIIVIAVLIFRKKRKTGHLGHYINPDSDETLHGHDGPMQEVHF